MSSKRLPILVLLPGVLLASGCARRDAQAVKAAKAVQKWVHPSHFSPKELTPLTVFMMQEKNLPPLQKVFPTDQNLTEVAEPGAGTKVIVQDLDPAFHNTLPGGWEHRRVALEIYQHLGEKWYPGFVDVVRQGKDGQWKVLLQCTSARASLGKKGALNYDPLSTNCYWSHFHHDRDWHKPTGGSFRRPALKEE